MPTVASTTISVITTMSSISVNPLERRVRSEGMGFHGQFQSRYFVPSSAVPWFFEYTS